MRVWLVMRKMRLLIPAKCRAVVDRKYVRLSFVQTYRFDHIGEVMVTLRGLFLGAGSVGSDLDAVLPGLFIYRTAKSLEGLTRGRHEQPKQTT